MGREFASWSLLLFLLLVMFAHGNGSRELTEKHLEAVPSDDHMEPQLMIFFTIKDIKAGKKRAIYFPKMDHSNSPPFLPREEAETIPLSFKQLPYIFRLFSISPDSAGAKAIQHSLKMCEAKPHTGETKICANSLESMLDFVKGVFGSDRDFTFIATRHLTNSTTRFQNYTILKDPEELKLQKFVTCHPMSYPYLIFGCHSHPTNNRVFKISLAGENGDRTEAIAVCHMNTSEWGLDHPAFRVLGVKPGLSEICHFFSADHLLYLPVDAGIN